MTETRIVRLSSARLLVHIVAGVAVVLAVLDGWAISRTPETSLYSWGFVADLVVAAVALFRGIRWPRRVTFGTDALVIGRRRIPYDSIAEFGFGVASAKRFWVTFWLLHSLIGVIVVAGRNRAKFNRQVVDIATMTERIRLRWPRNLERRSYEECIAALRAARPDLVPRKYIEETAVAREYTPKRSIGGGILAAGLVYWLLIGGFASLQLVDISGLESGPFSTAGTRAALATLATQLKNVPSVFEVDLAFETERCDRKNPYLGYDPDFVDLHLRLAEPLVSQDLATAVETQIRADLGIPQDAVFISKSPNSDVGVDVSSDHGLNAEISTGCVSAADVPLLQDDLRRVAAAMGAKP